MRQALLFPKGSSGGGGGAPVDAEYVTLAADATLTNEGVLGTAVNMTGTLAAIPAASRAGRLYWTTDTFVLYRDTGAAWVAVGAGLDGTGLIPTAQMATGSPTAAKALMGDRTWQAVLAASAYAAAGDVLYATAAATPAVVPVGGNAGAALVAQSSAAAKVAYGFPVGLHKTLDPTGVLNATMSRNHMKGDNMSFLVSGTLVLFAIALPKDLLITSITCVSGTTGAGTPTNQWFGLFDASRNQLRLTANDTTTAWAANTAKTLNLTSTYTTTVEGLHYIGVLVTATTVPILLGRGSSSGTVDALPPIMCGSSSTGLTTPASCPNPVAALTANAAYVYAYLK